MIEIEVESPLGRPNFKLRGENQDLVEKAAVELRKALDYIDHLPFNRQNSTEQVRLRREEIAGKYHVEIVME